MKVVKAHGTNYHWCPGCNKPHPLPERWTFNGDMEKPTFSPSFRQYPTREMEGDCHYIVTDGVLHFQKDSWHELKGQSVPMPECPEDVFKKLFE